MAEELKEAPPLPLWRRAAGILAPAAHGAREFLESAPPALRPAAFLPWFMLNLQHLPEALERTEAYGGRRRFSTPTEVLQGAPTERTPMGDLAQMVFAAGGVQPTAQLARAGARLPLQALNRMAEGPGPLASQIGAVKAPGGEWLESSIEAVADKLGRWSGSPETMRMAKNYLNRYIGTSEDPIKDLMVRRSGEETDVTAPLRRWEDITDLLISSAPRWTTEEGKAAMVDMMKNPRGNDTIFKLEYSPPYDTKYIGSKSSMDYVKAEDDFFKNLTKAGQHLETIPRAKWGQYDLPRLMRELRDKELIQEKAVADDLLARQEGLVVAKDYPDAGLRWVEIAKPERLTPKQRLLIKEVPGSPEKDTAPTYIPLDSRRRPIMNEFTAPGEDAKPITGTTPEEAWLFGKLTQEGNVMRHCTGNRSRCDDATRGLTRIFSLRDREGKSLITASLEREKLGGAWELGETPKTKYNQKVPAELEPYVEDWKQMVAPVIGTK